VWGVRGVTMQEPIPVCKNCVHHRGNTDTDGSRWVCANPLYEITNPVDGRVTLPLCSLLRGMDLSRMRAWCGHEGAGFERLSL
jgi:hypothetical protein